MGEGKDTRDAIEWLERHYPGGKFRIQPWQEQMLKKAAAAPGLVQAMKPNEIRASDSRYAKGLLHRGPQGRLVEEKQGEPVLGKRAEMLVCDDVTGKVSFPPCQCPTCRDERAQEELMKKAAEHPPLSTKGFKAYLEPWKAMAERRGEELRKDLEKEFLWGRYTAPVYGVSDIAKGISLVSEFNKRYSLENEVLTDLQKNARNSMAQCPFCGAGVKRTENAVTFNKRGSIKRVKDVYIYRCGTRKTAGELEVEKPRVRLGKDCTGPAI